MKYGLKSVSVFAFTNKLKLAMKGDELELWIVSLTTCNFITVQINRRLLIFTASIKRTLGKVPKVST